MTATPEELSQIWQRQALDAPRVSLEFLRHRAHELRRRTQTRNAFEYVTGVTCLAFVTSRGWDLMHSRPLMQIAIGLWIAAGCTTLFRWHQLAKAKPSSAEAGVLDTLSFYRQQLVRQRDARRGSWRMAWLTAAPGLGVLFASLLHEFLPTPWTTIGLLTAWLAFGACAGAIFYRKDAQRIQDEIDALDSLSR